jgi:ubiquinone/menaquinone biosynthesis C-methylase UbiE
MISPHHVRRLYTLWAITRIYDIGRRMVLLGTANSLHEELLQSLRLGSGSLLLDLACGPAPGIKSFRRSVGEHGRLFCLDENEAMISCAKRRGTRSALSHVSFIRGDASMLPFQNATLDAVSAVFCLSVISNYTRALNESLRVLRRGGRFAALEQTAPGLPLGADSLLAVASRLLAAADVSRPFEVEIRRRFTDVKIKPLFGGIISLINGEKP